MREAGYFQPFCRKHHGQGDVAALGKDEIGSDGGKFFLRLFHRPPQGEGNGKIAQREPADEFGTGDLSVGDL